MLESFASEHEVSLSEDEIIYGFGFEFYPLNLVQLADTIIEMSGHVPDQDQIMSYDPAWIRDISRYRRWKAAIKKTNGNGK